MRGLATVALAMVVASSATSVSATPITFLVYGDSRAGTDCTGNAVHIPLASLMDAENADFVVHVGDMITGFTDTTNFVQNGSCTGGSNFGSLQNIIASLQGKTPPPGLPTAYLPVVGNHDDNWGEDWYPDPFGNGFCDLFDVESLVPNHTQQPYFIGHGTPTYTDPDFYSRACSTTSASVYPPYMYYSLDYLNIHVLVLRVNTDFFDLEACNSCGPDKTDYDDYFNIHQLDFIKWDLDQASANPAINKILVFLHAPLFTTCSSHSANASWQTLTKEFSAHNVDTVFSGHAHVYERTVPIVVDDANPTGVQNDTDGTVYFTTGGGGSPLHSFNASQWFTASRAVAYHYLRVTIDGPTTTVEAVDQNGTVFDSYSRTGPGGAEGTVVLDAAMYGCSGSVGIQVTDMDLVGDGTVAVDVWSDTELAGETVTLTEDGGNLGTFNGSISVTSAPPSGGDGFLSTVDGDTISVEYIDVDDGQGNDNVPRQDTAGTDCVSPVLSNVSGAGTSTSGASVTWTTDEAGTSTVRYGTSPPGGSTESDPTLVTSHDTELNALSTCTKYFYSVESADGVGNLTADDNGGLFYTFSTWSTAGPLAPVSDTLRVNRNGSNETEVSWDAASQEAYNVYRGYFTLGNEFTYDHQCLETGVPESQPTTTVVDPLDPRPYTLFYYLAGSTCSPGGAESSLGEDGSGNPRPGGQSCPDTNRDTDGDGIEEAADNCPGLSNPSQSDLDGDSHGDVCDNCPTAFNPEQIDSNADGQGDACPQTTLDYLVSATSDDAEENTSGDMYLDSSDLELVRDVTNQRVGIRFTVVGIPQGAQILNAYVQFTVDETSGESTSLTIRGEAVDDAPTFTTSTGNISGRTPTAASVGWSPPPWNTLGAADTDQRTPNLAPILEEIVGRPGWSPGNALVIVITGTGKRVAESFDGTAPPLLHVVYGPPG